ncbi:hypothetical protein AB0B71_11720 [Micromonospora echinofusca]|uniref:hypothetical protein n=1 Tax=Micromonospora echinofusca TaxID=47858 RepID=UPI0033D3AFAE
MDQGTRDEMLGHLAEAVGSVSVTHPRERYIPSQQLYFATVRPTDHVDIVVHNDEPQQPLWATQTH